LNSSKTIVSSGTSGTSAKNAAIWPQIAVIFGSCAAKIVALMPLRVGWRYREPGLSVRFRHRAQAV
jgi:hypothetical protein